MTFSSTYPRGSMAHMEDLVVYELQEALLPSLLGFEIEVLGNQVDWEKDQLNRATPIILVSAVDIDHEKGFYLADPIVLSFVAIVPGGNQRERRSRAFNACQSVANWMRNAANSNPWQPGRTTMERIHPAAIASLTATRVSDPYLEPPVPITAPAYLEPGQSGTASVPAVTGATYTWAIAGGVITAGQGTASVTIQAGALGDLSLACQITTASANCGGSATVQVVPAPAVTIALPPTVVTGGTYTATAVLESGGESYAWSISGGTITAGQGTGTVTYVPWDAGSVLDLTCAAVDSRGLAGTGTASSTVVAPLYQRVKYRTAYGTDLISPASTDPLLDILAVGNETPYVSFEIPPQGYSPDDPEVPLVQVDAGIPVALTGASVICGEGYLFSAWAIYGSADASTWTQLGVFTGPGGYGPNTETLEFSATYRYWQCRLVGNVYGGYPQNILETRFLPFLS